MALSLSDQRPTAGPSLRSAPEGFDPSGLLVRLSGQDPSELIDESPSEFRMGYQTRIVAGHVSHLPAANDSRGSQRSHSPTPFPLRRTSLQMVFFLGLPAASCLGCRAVAAEGISKGVTAPQRRSSARSPEARHWTRSIRTHRRPPRHMASQQVQLLPLKKSQYGCHNVTSHRHLTFPRHAQPGRCLDGDHSTGRR
jgi:hypothetical protein